MTSRARLSRTGLSAGAVSSAHALLLDDGWTLTATPPGACADPSDLGPTARWDRATVPGTVALSVGPDDLDRHLDYDAADWWYRCTIPGPAFDSRDSAQHRIRFDGLATLAEVWFNGERVLTSSDMFCPHEVDVTDLVEASNTLFIAFRSLGSALAIRRPRPRWKTKLVEHQQLRWFRTTLLGRIPGWTPAIAPVGPWRPIWLESIAELSVESLELRSALVDNDGLVEVRARIRLASEGHRVMSATLNLCGQTIALEVALEGDAWSIEGTARIAEPDLWWPATHGEATLHDCAVEIDTSAGSSSIDCGRVGFRSVSIERDGGRVQFVVNGVPVFCRGSCWTSNDVVSLVGDQKRTRQTLELLAEAHGNMVRVGGTMVYETEEFYRACDELGIMVWQDFMFANMDYPVEDADFANTLLGEVDVQLRRLSRHASVVAYCGGSEVEQQAAMFGAPRDIWSNRFFSTTLPELVGRYAPGIPYWPSTPTGGALPFHVGEGLTHYYGLGAYRRPLEDVRLAGVRFAPECLGFSNVPEMQNLRSLTQGGSVAPHDPAWKRGVPRDTGAGWDFEDIRDHYLERLYGAHAVDQRSKDLELYLSLSRVVTGEVMEHAFSEWRREGDLCGGALTWFLKDLRPGAGWGIVDSDGQPKAAYYHLARSWAPQCVRLLDRGLDGLRALVVNETSQPLEVSLELLALAGGRTVVSEATRDLVVSPRSSVEVPVEDAFGHFVDTTYSYRFGPLRHEAVVARLIEDGEVLSEDVYRPVRSAMTRTNELEASVRRVPTGGLVVQLSTIVALYGVRIQVRDHQPLDNYFCLTPGRQRSVYLAQCSKASDSFQGHIEALNLVEPRRLTAPA